MQGLSNPSIREARSDKFSAHPGRDYFLPLTIPLLLFDLYYGARVYYCWHTISGLTSAVCNSDRIINEETAGHEAIFAHAAVIYNLFLIPILAAIYAPFFLAAVYISRCWHIAQNMTGILYWLIAWILIGLGPVATAALADFILDGRAGMHDAKDWMLFAFVLGTHGASAGVVYCILSFRRRGHA